MYFLRFEKMCIWDIQGSILYAERKTQKRRSSVEDMNVREIANEIHT